MKQLTLIVLIMCISTNTNISTAEVSTSTDVINAAREQADASMRRAWQEGSEEELQPMNKVVGSDGSLAFARNAPRQIVMKASGEPGLNDRHTTITVIQQPTPIPVKPPQKTSIQTTVNGIDKIETRASLPELLGVDQLDAIKKIADNGTLIAQQRFGLEQHKINQDADLEHLRIVKSFVLWGFLASIPFMFTSYWVLKNVLSGYQNLQKDLREYKLKELEVTDNMLYDNVSKNAGGMKS